MTHEVTCEMLPSLYNQYLIDLLMHVKNKLKGAISAAGHKAISPDTKEHIDTASKSLFRPLSEESRDTCRSCLANLASLDGEGSEAELAMSFEPLSAITFKQFLDAADEEDNSRNLIATYVYTLATLAAVYHESDDALTSNVSRILTRAQSDLDNPEILQAMDGILEDDIVHLLEKVSEYTIKSSPPPDADADAEAQQSAEAVNEILEKMKDSKIASIAEEISKDIDVTTLGDISSGINFSDLTNSSSPLGSIVNKVGSTIQKKMASGELNQADLMREACTFLGAAGGAGAGAGGSGGGGGMPDMSAMADMFSMFTGGGGGTPDLQRAARAMSGTPMGRKASAQARLRRKLDQKKGTTNP